MTRLAAIDIGTNSTKMTVADVDDRGQVSVVTEDTDVTRLGEGVDAAKRLNDNAVARTLDAVVRFAEAARQQGAREVLVAGTSALRDAANGPDFIAQVKDRAGVELQIITGDREAHLAFAAVRSDPSLALASDASLLVFDIGGGSTELILGDANGVGRHKSLDMGAVRLTERFLHSDPPTDDELEQARRFAEDAFAAFPPPSVPPMVAGIGGTAVNIAAVTLRAQGKEGEAHAATLSASDVEAALDHFRRVPLAERRQIPGLEPKRADIITGGALILSCLLAHFHADHCTVSARGLRYGLLAERAGALSA